MSLSGAKQKNARREEGHLDNEGFAGHLQGASLADVVQLRCLSGQRGSIRVQCDARVGQLFFDRGQLLYAVLEGEERSGEEAALEILSWSHGAFESCALEWPRGPELRTSWQPLLLMAAQRLDEQRHAEIPLVPKETAVPPPDKSRMVAISAERLAALEENAIVNNPVNDAPGPSTLASSSGILGPRETDEHAALDSTDESHRLSPVPPTGPKVALTRPSPTTRLTSESGTMRAPSRAPMVKRTTSDVAAALFAQAEQAVRLDRSGRLHWSHRENEGFVGLAAYAARVLDLISEELSVGQFQSFECELGPKKFLMYSETKEVFMALQLPSSVNTSAFRAQLNDGQPWSARPDRGRVE